MKLLSAIFFFLITTISWGQVELTASDEKVIQNELVRLVNELRESKGLDPLEKSKYLENAAQLQANYQAKIKNVTHDNKSPKLATPSLRVWSVEGKMFEYVGENCASVSIEGISMNKKQLKEAAKRLFNGWKNSPGHYKNMITEHYTHGDFGFSIDPKSKTLFSTQVFAKEGFTVEGQLSDDAWGVEMGDTECNDKYKGFGNIVLNMGNSIEIKERDIELYYHDISYFNKIFKNKNDGLAVDLVFREQVSCEGENYLDVSPIYDGIILEPNYKKELWEGNSAESKYRLITKIGELPEEHVGKDFQISLILISEGKKCKYIIPSEVPRKKYKLRDIEPFTLDNEMQLTNKGIILSQELDYDFKRNNSKPLKYPDVIQYDSTIHSVNVICYTSIEGDTSINNRIHNSRAKTISSHLKSRLDFPDSILHVEAKENWDKMNFQLQYFFQDSLLKWPQDSLRKLVRSEDETLNWDSLLFAQRRSSAIINYSIDIPDSMMSECELVEMNLKTAIVENNWDKANKALFELFHLDYKFKADVIFDKTVMEAYFEHPALVRNAAACISKVYHNDLMAATEFVNIWVNRRGELDIESIANVVYLYTLLSNHLIDRWDLPAKRLSNVIHPKKINVISEDLLPPELVLNLHLTFIEYYGQINNQKGISESFYFIKDYFQKRSLSPEDDVDLCLFFNSWSMYHLTTNYLKQKFVKKEINEDGVFLLLQTWWFYHTEDMEDYMEISAKAKEMNSERWCRYIYRNYQNMREPEIKEMYCETCN